MKGKVFVISVLAVFLLAIFVGGALAAKKSRITRVSPVNAAQPSKAYTVPSPVMYESGMQPDCEDINPDAPQLVIQHGQFGYTWYDEQQIGSMGRMIAVGPSDHTHGIYHRTDGPYGVTFPRYVDYNCKDPLDSWCGPFWIDGGTDINAGYGQMLLFHEGREVALYHRQDWDATLKVGEPGFPCLCYLIEAYDLPDSHDAPAGSDPNGIWPKGCVVYDGDTETDYIHVVTTEPTGPGGAQTIAYQRCYFDGNTLRCSSPGYGPYATPPNTYMDSRPIAVFDTTKCISAVVVSSPLSRKVAIVYIRRTDPGPQYNNDIVYIESTNNGDDWLSGTQWPPIKYNVTYYSGGNERAYTDVAACYDYNDHLHIVWNSHFYDPADPTFDANLYHWTDTYPLGHENATLVAFGRWDDGTVAPGAWNRTICKMSIAAKDPIYHPGGEPDSVYLFCIWTQFDLGDNSLGGYSNGDIYAAISNDAGATWTPGYNLTNTKTPDCQPGDCLSEHWSSLAENMYDGELYIQYVCDRDAGGAIYDEGAWTENPMMYLHLGQLLWQETCGVDIKLMDPPGDLDAWHTPPLKVVPGEDRMIAMKLTGLYTLPGAYHVTTDNPNVVCVVNCSGILYPQEEKIVEILIDCQEEGFLVARIYVTTCIGTQDEKTDTIMLHVVQSENYYECPRDSATWIEKDNCVLKAKFWVNCEERVWDKRIYPEEKQQVIFSASSIVATTWQGDTIVGRQDYCDVLTGARDTIHHVVGIDPDQPECALQVVWSHNTFVCANNLPPPNHQRWWWIDIHKQIFMWHDTLGLQCPNWKKEQIIKQMWITKSQCPLWWPNPPAQQYEDIYFGFFADVDAPDDSCWGANFAGYDYVRKIIWHNGLGPPPTYNDYYVGHAFTDRNGGVVAPLGCQDVLNKDYLWPNCGGWGWKEGELYQLAATPGVNIHSPGAADDRTVVLTVDMIPGGTGDFFSEYILIEAFIPTGLADLQAHIDATRGILIPQLDSLGLFDQCPICGDVNEDGKIDAADIVYLINYLYIPGAPPPSWPISRADANGDDIIDAADVVYLINYLYVPGAPAPNCPGFEP